MAVAAILKFIFGKRENNTNPHTGAVRSVNEDAADTQLVIEPEKLTYKNSQKLFLKYLFDDGKTRTVTVPQKLVIETVLDNLKKKENRIHAIPRLPTVIPKLLRSLRDPDSSVKDYVNLVIKDPVLSAAVLKLANSAYFNPISTRIEDIDKAIVKLGTEGLRSVLSAAVMQPIIQRESPYFSQTGQKLWLHSLNCAVACEIMATERRLDKFKLYLIGLMHDIGKITLFSELCKQFKLNGTNDMPGFYAFAPAVAKYSTALSYHICKDWELPEEICNAVYEQIQIRPGVPASAYAKILFEANIACEKYAVTQTEERETLFEQLYPLKLPKNLFEALDRVSTEL